MYTQKDTESKIAIAWIAGDIMKIKHDWISRNRELLLVSTLEHYRITNSSPDVLWLKNEIDYRKIMENKHELLLRAEMKR